MLPTSLPRRGSTILALLLVAGVVLGHSTLTRDSGVAEAPRGPAADCAEIQHPLGVRVISEGPVIPGRSVNARVEVTAHRMVDDVLVSVAAPPRLRLLSEPRQGLGLLRRGETRSSTITVVAPADGGRKVVPVTVSAHVDGVPVTRGAVLNLVTEQEEARVVTRPDGSRIRQVEARRIGR